MQNHSHQFSFFCLRVLRISFAVLFLTAVFNSYSTRTLAAGDPDPKPTKPAEPEKEKCDKGTVWSKKHKKCVKKTAEDVTDEDLYEAAVDVIKEADYQEGLDLLWRIKDQQQPKVLNYIGYSTRKMGKVDEGIEYYQKALKLDAKFVQARQYLGEGYLQKGDLQNAKAQLSEIEKNCGTTCEYYTELSKQIASYEKDGKVLDKKVN